MRAFLIVTLLLVVPLAAVHGRTNALNVTFTLSKPFTELPFFAFGTLGVTQVRVGRSSPTSVVFALVKADRMTGDRVAAHIKTERAICNATDPPFETPRLSPASNTTTATITITDPGYYALIVYRCAAPGEAASVVVPIVVTQYNVVEPRTEPCTTSSSDEILSVLSLFVLAVHLGCTLLWLHFLRQRSERTPSDDLLLTSLTSIAVATCVNLEMRRIALYDRRRFSDALQSSYEATIEVTQAASTALMFTFVALTGLSRQLRLLLFALGTGQFIFHVASLCALNTEDTLSDTSRTLVDATCCMVTLLPVVSMMLHRHPAQTLASEAMEHPHVVAVVEASPQELVETEGQVVVAAPTLDTLPPSGSQPALQRYMWLYTAIVLFFYAVGLLVAIEGHLAYTTAWVCQAFILFVTWCFHLYCAAAMGHQQQLVQPI